MEKVWYIEDIGRELPGMLPRITEGPTGVFAVVDANVAERFAPQLEESGVVWMPFEAREERKSLGNQVCSGAHDSSLAGGCGGRRQDRGEFPRLQECGRDVRHS